MATLQERLKSDAEFYTENLVKIVDKAGRVIPLVPRPAQVKFNRALERQRDNGLPMRAVVLKARQLGFSTWTQALFVMRTTQEPNHRALTIAQDNNTAGALWSMAELMHANLPVELQPKIRNRRRERELAFGEPSSAARLKGDLGLNSLLRVDTAKEIQASRGMTYRSLHCSEVAFWPDSKAKLTGLLQTVPDEPGTLVVLESTANGYNHFKTLWDSAEAGESDYVAVFSGWHEDPTYTREFLTAGEREAFIERIGEGEYGEDEPLLVDRFAVTAEQLNWRRWAILNKCQGDLRLFKQEYPAYPEEAFLATGRQVFATNLTQRAVQEAMPPAWTGTLKTAKTVTRRLKAGTVEVPTEIEWRDDPRGDWHVWEQPDMGDDGVEYDDPAGRYIVAVDPAGNEEGDGGESAFHAIQVIDHRTRRQVAEYECRTDPDLVAVEALKAALYFNKAWLVVERTGGYGHSMNRKLAVDFAYPRLYRQRRVDTRNDRFEDRLGWDTNRGSKPLLEDGMKEMLREGTHGIRSRRLALQLTWYVKASTGKTGPEEGKFSDLLMAYMIGQQIALEKPVPKERHEQVSTTTRRYRNKVTGY